MSMHDGIPIEGPAKIGAEAVREFFLWTWLVLQLPPPHGVPSDFRVTKVEWNPVRQWPVVRFDGLTGDSHAHATVNAIGRLVSVRSRRRDQTTGELLPVPMHWRVMLKRHFSPMFLGAGSLDVADGWFDLIAAMSDNVLEIEDVNDPMRFIDIKSKYAELRADYSSHDPRIAAVVDAFETISSHVCETCGNPGKIEGPGWLIVACQKHTKR